MFIIQHLKQRYNGHMREYKDLCDEIEVIQNELDGAIDARLELRWKRQLEGLLAKRERKAEELQMVKDQIAFYDTTYKLRTALTNLNYYSQMSLFADLLVKSPIGAFLIYGKRSCGHEWLLKRLMLEQVPSYMTAKRAEVDLSRSFITRDIDGVRGELSRGIGIRKIVTLEEVVQEVHRLWQTQTVLLFFYHLSEMDASYISELFQQFWRPLVQTALNTSGRSDIANSVEKHQLLMFVVEEKEAIDNWPVVFTEEINATWEPTILVKLPRLVSFDKELLESWKRQQSYRLPENLRSIQIETVYSATHNGTPQEFLNYICAECLLDWKCVLDLEGKMDA